MINLPGYWGGFYLPVDAPPRDMSKSGGSVRSIRFGTEDEGRAVIDDAERVQAVLDAITDEDCRAVLDATGDRALTASEVSEACELPLSTAYRKLDALTDAGLVLERTRIRRSGKHTSEFVRLVEDVVVSVGTSGGVSLEVVTREDAVRRSQFPPVEADD